MEAFSVHGLVGKIIDRVPQKQLSIHYGNTEVQPGMNLTPSMTKHQPHIKFEADANSYYTLIMNDADFPSHSDQKMSEFQHWLIVNIPGNDLSRGDVLTEYVGPLPNKGTGHHRYVFMLFKQSKGKMEFRGERRINNRTSDGRKVYNMMDFARKHFLVEPVYGNFFQSEWDESVPKIYEQMKM
ncbi:protein D2 [Octopus bimaculoides]|uniref:Phosphatidylethanolamine-binding protein n=2 Tax=Octopus bimaculoides TaxID=37653 RepID=A0A0L8IHP5_OCTBM|nr:protein D2 [Octopus bimaculoides]|eukprot:XP_014774319.1 PREDICTED: protein D2-like isoform X1 [Octopus bimaculoides]